MRGWRNVHVTDGDQPYMKHWWVPGLQIGYEHTFTHQFADFVQAAANGKCLPPTFRDGLATDYVTDAVLKSAKCGKWEKVQSMRTRNIAATVAVPDGLLLAGLLSGQQPGGARPRRGGGRAGHSRCPFEDHAGFVSIFDGSTLKGWDGDTKFWRVEGGAIVGQTTADNPLKENSFIIWRGGEPADFELKVEYRINATNSGIQIRSVHLPAGYAAGARRRRRQLGPERYQCDIDAENRFTGQIYEERGRGFLAMRGQFTYIPDGGGPKVVGALQRSADELLKVIKVNDWNQAHVIARGNMITEILNGHVTSTLVDDDTKARALKGLLGFQIHVGEPMKVEFKNIWLKQDRPCSPVLLSL